MSLQAFETYLRAGWRRHADSAHSVANSFEEGLAILGADTSCESKLPDLARLIEHTLLSHRGSVCEMEVWTERLQALAYGLPTSKIAVQRMRLAVQVARGRKPPLPPIPKDQQLSGCVNGLVAHCARGTGEVALNWIDDFVCDLSMATRATAKAMAGATNSLSFHLNLNPMNEVSREVMLSAALLSRDARVKLGNWRDIGRAEHFLALSYAAAGLGEQAVERAHRCHQICKENQAPPCEFFLAAEALARGLAASRDAAGAIAAVHLMEQVMSQVPDVSAQAYCAVRLRETREFTGACDDELRRQGIEGRKAAMSVS